MAQMVQGHPVLVGDVAGQFTRRKFGFCSCHGDAPDPSFCSVWAVSSAVHTPAGGKPAYSTQTFGWRSSCCKRFLLTLGVFSLRRVW
jgi:hypothetical protein